MTYGKFAFHGTGLGFLGTWLINMLLCVVTFGLYGPWACVAILKWLAGNTTIDGQRLVFRGTGIGFFGQYLLILVLTVITLGIYSPWGYCRLMRWMTENTSFADAPGNAFPVSAARPSLETAMAP